MAAPAIGIRPRWVPATSRIIDKSHPLAQGLVGLWVGGNPTNLVTGTDLLALISPIAPESTIFGQGFAHTTTLTTARWRYTPPASNPLLISQGTIVWAGELKAASTGGSPRIFAIDHSLDSTVSPFISFGIYRSSTTALTAGAAHGSTFIASGAISTGATASGIAIGVYSRLSNNLEFYWNNMASGAPTANAGNPIAYGANSNVMIGVGDAVSANPNSVMSLGALYNIPLDANARAVLNADPFCMLRR